MVPGVDGYVRDRGGVAPAWRLRPRRRGALWRPSRPVRRGADTRAGRSEEPDAWARAQRRPRGHAGVPPSPRPGLERPALCRMRVNGTVHPAPADPRRLLSDHLRHDLGLTGTHVGCEHGVCGCCTVLFDGAPVRSCLMLAVQAEGHEVSTVEGLAADG